MTRSYLISRLLGCYVTKISVRVVFCLVDLDVDDKPRQSPAWPSLHLIIYPPFLFSVFALLDKVVWCAQLFGNVSEEEGSD